MSKHEVHPFYRIEQTESEIFSPSGLWVSENVASTKRFSLPAHAWSMVPVLLQRSHILPIVDEPVDDFSDFRISMRSRFAQIGLQPDSMKFAHTFPKRAWKKLRETGEVEVKVPIFNWAGRPVMVDDGQKLFHLYNEGQAVPLKGLELIKAVQNDIKIDGSMKWAFKSGESRTSENLVGIWLPISYDKAMCIPQARRAIQLSENGSSRESVKRYTAPLEDYDGDTNFAFHLAHTPHVRIHGYKHLLISPNLRHILQARNSGQNNAYHIESRVIDGKNYKSGEIRTDWEIILEIVGPIHPASRRPTHVLMLVYPQYGALKKAA